MNFSKLPRTTMGRARRELGEILRHKTKAFRDDIELIEKDLLMGKDPPSNKQLGEFLTETYKTTNTENEKILGHLRLMTLETRAKQLKRDTEMDVAMFHYIDEEEYSKYANLIHQAAIEQEENKDRKKANALRKLAKPIYESIMKKAKIAKEKAQKAGIPIVAVAPAQSEFFDPTLELISLEHGFVASQLKGPTNILIPKSKSNYPQPTTAPIPKSQSTSEKVTQLTVADPVNIPVPSVRKKEKKAPEVRPKTASRRSRQRKPKSKKGTLQPARKSLIGPRSRQRQPKSKKETLQPARKSLIGPRSAKPTGLIQFKCDPNGTILQKSEKSPYDWKTVAHKTKIPLLGKQIEFV